MVSDEDQLWLDGEAYDTSLHNPYSAGDVLIFPERSMGMKLIEADGVQQWKAWVSDATISIEVIEVFHGSRYLNDIGKRFTKPPRVSFEDEDGIPSFAMLHKNIAVYTDASDAPKRRGS